MFDTSDTIAAQPAPTVDWLSLMAYGFIADVVQTEHQPEDYHEEQ
jgi:hypothetical protein